MIQECILIQGSRTWRQVDLVNLYDLVSKIKSQFLDLAHSNCLYNSAITFHNLQHSINHPGGETQQLEDEYKHVFDNLFNNYV